MGVLEELSVAIEFCQRVGVYMSDDPFIPANDWDYTTFCGVSGFVTDLYAMSPAKGILPSC